MPTSILQRSTVPLRMTAVPVVEARLGGARLVNRSLDFTLQQQRQTQWCWAAVAASVASYYRRSGWSQCRLVSLELSESTCCVDGVSAECNRPWYLDKALDRVRNLAAYTPRPLRLQQIRLEIDGTRPIGVRIGWRGGGGHFVVICGYSELNVLDIHDPWFGRSSVDYLAFRRRYQGNGRWTHSYQTMPRGTERGS